MTLEVERNSSGVVDLTIHWTKEDGYVQSGGICLDPDDVEKLLLALVGSKDPGIDSNTARRSYHEYRRRRRDYPETTISPPDVDLDYETFVDIWSLGFGVRLGTILLELRGKTT